MDRTQRTATFAGLALVAASLVGAVVVNQGSGDVMLGNAPLSPTEVMVAGLADDVSVVSDVDGYGEEPEGEVYEVEQYDHEGDDEQHDHEEHEYEGGDDDAEGDDDDD